MTEYDYNAASLKMGYVFTNTTTFIVNAIEWLGEKFGDLHLEYHQSNGWQVSSCFSDGIWSDDGWIRGDGSMKSALCAAILISEI